VIALSKNGELVGRAVNVAARYVQWAGRCAREESANDPERSRLARL